MEARFSPITGQTALDSTGAGTVTLTPGSRWREWTVTHLVVWTDQAASATPVPTAVVWVNEADVPRNRHGGTRSASFDTGDGAVEMGGADVLVVVFAGGIAGSIAYVTAHGRYKAELGRI